MSLFCTSSRKGYASSSIQKSLRSLLDRDPRHLGPALFIVGSGGGGHKASAIAVQDCLLSGSDLRQRETFPQIEFIAASDVVEEAISGSGGPNGDDFYNWCLQNGWYRIAGMLGYFASFGVGLLETTIENAFAKLWMERQPAVVVSFVPFLNTGMRRALALTCPGTKLVTVVTDFSSSSAHPWIDLLEDDEAGANHVVVAGTQEVEDLARQFGYKQVLRTSGMVVNPSYYVNELCPEMPSVLRFVIFFGGHAPFRAQAIAHQILESHVDSSVVVLCGGNSSLHEALQPQVGDYRGRLIVEGFLPAERIRDYLITASCVIGKPGPGVAGETAVCGTPLVVERSVGLVQEELVQKWLESTGLGVVVDDLEDLPANLIERLDNCKGPLAAHENRAVFAVSEYLQSLVLEVQAHVIDPEDQPHTTEDVQGSA